jgi:hypothetical protein
MSRHAETTRLNFGALRATARASSYHQLSIVAIWAHTCAAVTEFNGGMMALMHNEAGPTHIDQHMRGVYMYGTARTLYSGTHPLSSDDDH